MILVRFWKIISRCLMASLHQYRIYTLSQFYKYSLYYKRLTLCYISYHFFGQLKIKFPQNFSTLKQEQSLRRKKGRDKACVKVRYRT